jgi:hypothetical protein
MPHRAAPSTYALSSGDVRGNRARELLVWRACFQSGHWQWSSFQHPKNRAGPLLSPAAARRSTAPPNAKRSSQRIAAPCIESHCARPDAIAADARKNRTGTPRGEGLRPVAEVVSRQESNFSYNFHRGRLDTRLERTTAFNRSRVVLCPARPAKF